MELERRSMESFRSTISEARALKDSDFKNRRSSREITPQKVSRTRSLSLENTDTELIKTSLDKINQKLDVHTSRMKDNLDRIRSAMKQHIESVFQTKASHDFSQEKHNEN